MNERDALRAIDSTLKNIGFKEIGPGIADYEGQLKVHGKSVDITLSIPDVRFSEKPRIHLKDRSQIPLELLAHVEVGTGICYASGAGLPVDIYQPGQAILRILEEVQRTLELSYAGRAEREIVDEYQHYWYPKLGVRTLLPRVSSTKTTKGHMFFACVDGNVKFMCIASAPNLQGYEAQFSKPVQLWYVDAPIGPTKAVAAPSTLVDLEHWFVGQDALQNRNWEDAFACLAARQLLFIAAPNALVGVGLDLPKDLLAGINRGAIRAKTVPAVIKAKTPPLKVERYGGTWCNLDDVTSRNNADDQTLKNVSIAIVGCGTIGSHLARMLIQCGAGNHARFSIYDTEILTEGNIGRHLLGFADIGKLKATALKAELERFHPQVEVQAFTDNAIASWPQLSGHDLIIDATGDWNVQSALNEYFLYADTEKPKALLHFWVFMNGAGVQSFLNLRDEHGCFRCLKPFFDQSWRYPAGNEKDELNLQPASCGDGSFVPFTVDASMMAASLASRAALDWANGKPGPRLRSAVVDIDRGRYQKPISPTPSAHCPACKSLRSRV